jgi:hypothetical protein
MYGEEKAVLLVLALKLNDAKEMKLSGFLYFNGTPLGCRSI